MGLLDLRGLLNDSSDILREGGGGLPAKEVPLGG